MAEPKQKVLVEVLPEDSIEGWDIQIWADGLVNTRSQIKEIKGIENVMIHTDHSAIVWVDRRYDANEIAEEIKELIRVPLDTSKEQLQLDPAPFQPGCECKAMRESDGSLTIYHCVYHRSIEHIHNGLIAIFEEMNLNSTEKNLPGQEIARAAILVLDRHKKNSLTGRIGKAKDENVGR